MWSVAFGMESQEEYKVMQLLCPISFAYIGTMFLYIIWGFGVVGKEAY